MLETLGQSIPIMVSYLGDPLFWLLLLAAVVLAGPVGMIPGVGSLAIVAIALPFVILNLDPAFGLLFIAGILALNNTMDSIPAILLGYPTVGTQVTVLEGFQLSQRGRSARTLGAVYAVSTIGGLIGAFLLALALPLIRPFIVNMSFPEITSMALFGIAMVSILSHGAIMKGLAVAAVGLIVGTIGLSPFSVEPRFTFGQLYLAEGLPIIPVVLGLFALPEIVDLTMTGRPVAAGGDVSYREVFRGIREGLRAWRIAIRGGLIGMGLAIIPGVGEGVIGWFTYVIGMVVSKDKSQFGKGSLEGLLAVESAQSAQNGGQAIPTLGFGIPGSTSWALMLTGLLSFGIAPGLGMLGQHLDITMGIVLTIGIGNLLVVLVAIALTPQLARLTLIPYPFIGGILLPLVFLSAYQSSYLLGDLWVLLATGAFGMALKWFGWPRPPFILAFILGPIIESNAWPAIEALGPLSFVTRPYSLGILVLGSVFIGFMIWAVKRRAYLQASPAGLQENLPPIEGGAGPSPEGTGHPMNEPPSGTAGFRARWRWEYLLWLVLLAWVGAYILPQTFDYRGGSRFLPLWASIAFLAFMAVLAARTVFSPKGETQIMDIGMRSGTGNEAFRRLLITVAWIGGFVLAIGTVGFQISAVLFPLVFILLNVPLRGWTRLWVLVPVSLAAIVTFGVMEELLHVFWPEPFIRNWLF